MTSLAPALLQRMPAHFRRSPTSVRRELSTMPDPISSPPFPVRGVAHPAAVVLDVSGALVGRLVAGVPSQFRQHVVDAPLAERRADRLRPGPAPRRAGVFGRGARGLDHERERLLGQLRVCHALRHLPNADQDDACGPHASSSNLS